MAERDFARGGTKPDPRQASEGRSTHAYGGPIACPPLASLESARAAVQAFPNRHALLEYADGCAAAARQVGRALLAAASEALSHWAETAAWAGGAALHAWSADSGEAPHPRPAYPGLPQEAMRRRRALWQAQW